MNIIKKKKKPTENDKLFESTMYLLWRDNKNGWRMYADWNKDFYPTELHDDYDSIHDAYNSIYDNKEGLKAAQEILFYRMSDAASAMIDTSLYMSEWFIDQFRWLSDVRNELLD